MITGVHALIYTKDAEGVRAFLRVTGPVRTEPFGLATSLKIPGGGTLGLYGPGTPRRCAR